MTSEINYACSLGSLCHSSQILIRNGLKSCSYPFDWIFSNCDTILHCMEDNFNVFLDKSYYINESPSKCGHSKYNNFMFNHHNPLQNADHYSYYIRCVDRFRNLLQKQEHKLFIMMFVNGEYNSHSNHFLSDMIDFNDKFSNYTSNYTLLVIINHPCRKMNHHAFTRNNNVHFLELHTMTPSNGVQFQNNDDNIYLDNVLKSNYEFNIKKSN
jgi:hypothetical protein